MPTLLVSSAQNGWHKTLDFVVLAMADTGGHAERTSGEPKSFVAAYRINGHRLRQLGTPACIIYDICSAAVLQDSFSQQTILPCGYARPDLVCVTAPSTDSTTQILEKVSRFVNF